MEWAKPKSATKLWLALLPLVLNAGCARQMVPQMTGDRSPAGQQLPFEGTADTRGISPTAEFTPALIPAGTTITVRLSSSLSSAFSRPGDSFGAILEEPIIVQGQTVAPQGATITGKVLDARPSGQLREPGYLRLVLTAVLLKGKVTQLQTSSIFAKGGPRGKRSPTVLGTSLPSVGKSAPVLPPDQLDVRYETGQRLTFRLVDPLPLRS